jgi:hypothetical protein
LVFYLNFEILQRYGKKVVPFLVNGTTLKHMSTVWQRLKWYWQPFDKYNLFAKVINIR